MEGGLNKYKHEIPQLPEFTSLMSDTLHPPTLMLQRLRCGLPLAVVRAYPTGVSMTLQMSCPVTLSGDCGGPLVWGFLRPRQPFRQQWGPVTWVVQYLGCVIFRVCSHLPEWGIGGV